MRGGAPIIAGVPPVATPDDASYASLVEPHRAELHAHCCRMLDSPADAEDALQEALVRAWKGLPHFEGRSSIRSWLYRISTNACLDVIARRRRVIPVDYEDAEDPHDEFDLEADYELRESVEEASLVAFTHLPPRQRAALVLRAALGYSARDTADLIGTSVPSVNSALQRARRTLAEIHPAGDERLRASATRCLDAMRRGEVDAMVAELTAPAGDLH